MTFEAVAITYVPFEQISLLPKATISRTLCVHITYIASTATPFEFSACAHSALHQADNVAKLRQEFLSMLELIAKIFCAVGVARTSEALGNTQPRVAVASAPFEQLCYTLLNRG